MDGGIKRKLSRYDGARHCVNETWMMTGNRDVRRRIMLVGDGYFFRSASVVLGPGEEQNRLLHE